MTYKILNTSTVTHHLDKRPREKTLPEGVRVCLVEAVVTHYHHSKGDRWVEYFYKTAEAKRAHQIQLGYNS